MWFTKLPCSVAISRILLCLVLAWTGTQYQAQGTFNIRHYLNSATDFNTVYETDSGFIVAGSGWDTIPASHLEMKLFRFDHTGELLDEIDIGGPDQDLWMYPSFGSDSALDDTFITQGSGGTHTDSSVGAFLTVFNAHLDTLLSVNVVSPYLNQPELGSNWISSYYSHIAEDSCILMECQIFSEENGNDCMIKKFDKSGNWLWDYFCPAAGENNIEIVRCIRSDFNGGCYLLWRSSYKDEGGNNNYNLNRSSVIHLNDEGEELEQWYSPNDDLLPASWIDFVVDHYNFVLAGCISVYPNEDPFHSQATVTKMDMEGNLEWFSRAGDYSEDVYRIFPEHQPHRHHQAPHCCQMIPLELFVFEGEKHKSGEYHECDYLLKHFELHQRKWSPIFTGSDPVGGYLPTILKKGDAPAEQNHRKQTEAFAPVVFFELQMTIPAECQKIWLVVNSKMVLRIFTAPSVGDMNKRLGIGDIVAHQ